ncbi:MAG: hypothetical protein RMJ88_17035, partial [Thermogemmata sp.]|nr:hypothetical protein [Thermogemmata sp.]
QLPRPWAPDCTMRRTAVQPQSPQRHRHDRSTPSATAAHHPARSPRSSHWQDLLGPLPDLSMPSTAAAPLPETPAADAATLAGYRRTLRHCRLALRQLRQRLRLLTPARRRRLRRRYPFCLLPFFRDCILLLRSALRARTTAATETPRQTDRRSEPQGSPAAQTAPPAEVVSRSMVPPPTPGPDASAQIPVAVPSHLTTGAATAGSDTGQTVGQPFNCVQQKGAIRVEVDAGCWLARDLFNSLQQGGPVRRHALSGSGN